MTLLVLMQKNAVYMDNAFSHYWLNWVNIRILQSLMLTYKNSTHRTSELIEPKVRWGVSVAVWHYKLCERRCFLCQFVSWLLLLTHVMSSSQDKHWSFPQVRQLILIWKKNKNIKSNKPLFNFYILLFLLVSLFPLSLFVCAFLFLGGQAPFTVRQNETYLSGENMQYTATEYGAQDKRTGITESIIESVPLLFPPLPLRKGPISPVPCGFYDRDQWG